MSKDTESEADLKVVTGELKRIGDEVKAFAEQAEKEIKASGEMSKELKSKVDETLVKQSEVQSRLSEIEQKLTRRGGGGEEERKSVGQRVVENDNVKSMMGARDGRVRVSLKAITSVVGSGGDLTEPMRVPTIVRVPDRRLTVRDLLTPGRTTSNAIEYVQETGFTNLAAIVSETVQKPESDLDFELKTTPVVTIAHWVQASKQILDDAPMLASYIDGRLRYGLMYVEELQLLKGSGTGGNLDGIHTQATAFVPAFAVVMQQHIDELRLALLQAELAEYPATGIVTNPINWARIELTKTSDGQYLFANPTQMSGPNLWGKPVVATQAMDEDEFLVGAFRLGAQLFDREDANVLISTEDRDNFIKNLVTIRAEERLGLAVYRPEAFIKGIFSTIT